MKTDGDPRGNRGKFRTNRPRQTATRTGGKTGPGWVEWSPTLSVGSYRGEAVAVITLSGVPWCACVPVGAWA